MFFGASAAKKKKKKPRPGGGGGFPPPPPPPPPLPLEYKFTVRTWSELIFTVHDQNGSEALLTGGTLRNSLICARDEPLL